MYAIDLPSQWRTVPAVQFEWDEEKDRDNQQKHGLSFQEARRLFESGVDYLEIFDPEHSESEDRFIAIGLVDQRLVVVWYAELAPIRHSDL